MELWDVCNKNRIKIGRSHTRGEVMKQGDYHQKNH